MTQLLVNIDVSDLAGAVVFYRDAFGLRPGRRLGTAAIEMLGAGVPVYLLEKPAGSAAIPDDAATRSYARHWTPIHLDLVVPDIQAALEKARNAGASVEGATRSEAWGHIAHLADPFGNGFCLIEFVGRGYDEISV